MSESHSRQSSEPFTTSSEEQEDFLRKKIETEIIDVLSKEEERQRYNRHNMEEDSRIDNLEEQIREQEVKKQKHNFLETHTVGVVELFKALCFGFKTVAINRLFAMIRGRKLVISWTVVAK